MDKQDFVAALKLAVTERDYNTALDIVNTLEGIINVPIEDSAWAPKENAISLYGYRVRNWNSGRDHHQLLEIVGRVSGVTGILFKREIKDVRIRTITGPQDVLHALTHCEPYYVD
jgi:hypothetical protein